MKQLFDPLINKSQWLEQLGFDNYSPEQQQVLWDLVTRALETKIIDTLLDQLNQTDQRALIQYLAEPELEDQLVIFLDKKVPKHHQLLQDTILHYQKQLKRDLNRLLTKK